jgi:drug/metabolite transporter (DMT)-like permease
MLDKNPTGQAEPGRSGPGQSGPGQNPPTSNSIPTQTLSNDAKGMLFGLAGVAIFSLTLPFTRMAVQELDPTFVALGRALVAALLAGMWLITRRAPFPPRSCWLPLALVAIGCVIGFPWLTSIAMQTLPAAHGAVLVGILPLATALFAALRGHEMPSLGFWLTALAGSMLVIAFALRQSGGSLHVADILMLAAVILGAIGYAEGGRLAKTMGGLAVISWALVLSAPLMLSLLLVHGWSQDGSNAWSNVWATHGSAVGIAAVGITTSSASIGAWIGFAYVSVFSMFIGFMVWYRGMALGGVARVGQTQLVQPFLTLLGAWALLGEALEWSTLLFALAVIALVALGRSMPVRR